MDVIDKTAPDLRTATVARLVKKGGFKAKIEAMCCYCIYDGYAEGNWRQQVERCTSFDCPLFTVRPKSKPRKGNEKS